MMMDDLEVGPPLKAENAKSLFAQQSVRGWWPCSIEKDGKKVLGVSMNKKYTQICYKATKQSLLNLFMIVN